MARQILVPLDGSSLAEKVLHCAKMLGRALPAELVLLHSVSIPYDPGAIQAGRRTDALAEQLDRGSREYLGKVAGDLRGAGLKVRLVVEQGPAAEAIVDTAADPEIQLIVMATHGFGGADQWARGSVAERVLQLASVPVLMLCSLKEGAGRQPTSCRRILVPLDGSRVAEQILTPTISIAKATNAEIKLLRVSIVYTSGEFVGDLCIPLEGTLQTAGQIASDYLDRVAIHLAEQGIKATTVVQMGPVAESIVEYAESNQIDLIAMCTHGRTGPGRWTLGSVSDRVLRSGCIPILLVRAE